MEIPWNILNVNPSGPTWMLPKEWYCSCCSRRARISSSSVNVEPMSSITCDVKASVDVGLKARFKLKRRRDATLRIKSQNGWSHLRYFDDVGKVIVSWNVTIVQILDGVCKITAQLSVFITVSVSIFSPVGLANCQRYSVESYKRKIFVSSK